MEPTRNLSGLKRAINYNLMERDMGDFLDGYTNFEHKHELRARQQGRTYRFRDSLMPDPQIIREANSVITEEEDPLDYAARQISLMVENSLWDCIKRIDEFNPKKLKRVVCPISKKPATTTIADELIGEYYHGEELLFELVREGYVYKISYAKKFQPKEN